ncbi:MAG: hypothetical protein MI745_03515 [Pseudomonadales bacterium]|nr:hypothetical protein [Pseudomonadales bacterium]
MGTQQCARIWHQQELAMEAVESRLQALGEYLAVYRASYASGNGAQNYARIRVLRNDIGRLRAWWWYLQACRRGAAWVPLLHRVVAILAVLVPVRRPSRRRRHVSRSMRHLSSYSLIERAYAALEDDEQGRLLTLRLAQYHRPTDSRSRDIAITQQRLADIAALRTEELPEPRQVSVTCYLLNAAMVARRCLGLRLPITNTVDY